MAEMITLELPPPFAEAVARHEAEIMRFLVRTTRDREDALDLFQETWLRAYRAYPTLDSAAGLRPWLFRIATNLCLNRARGRMRRARVFADEQPDIGRWGGAAANGDQVGVLELKSAIAGLPDKQRQALVMRKFGGLGYDAIAEALDCSQESARAGVYQALKKLKAVAER